MRQHFMHEIDEDKDGLVSEAEFVKMARSEKFARDEQWQPVNPEAEIPADKLAEFAKHKSRVKVDANMLALAKAARERLAREHGQRAAGDAAGGAAAANQDPAGAAAAANQGKPIVVKDTE